MPFRSPGHVDQEDLAHGANSGQGTQSAARAELRRRQPSICPTDDDADLGRVTKLDKQSTEYIWKSGLAGGLAGCAVSMSCVQLQISVADKQ